MARVVVGRGSGSADPEHLALVEVEVGEPVVTPHLAGVEPVGGHGVAHRGVDQVRGGRVLHRPRAQLVLLGADRRDVLTVCASECVFPRRNSTGEGERESE